MELNEELIQRVKASEKNKSIWRKDYNSKEFEEASRLNVALFGERLEKKPGCECVEIFFFNLNRKLNQTNLKQIMNKEFKIKEGKIIQNHSFATPISASSSDEDCIKLLKINKSYSKFFSKLPLNWEEIIEGKAKVDSKHEVIIEAKKKASVEEVVGEVKEFISESNEDDFFNEMSVAELKEYAKQNSIEIESKKKADIISEIKTALDIANASNEE